ncbi:MAG: sensor histidine kinase KdpD [Pseudomonadota bacterium]|jgi:two-component system sensor histidine kinase KdpD|uniref:DUF4118 domain-containing protein n=1 Tax=unclassified Tepidimonas TaxID=2631705 RepID=UPI00347F4AB6
MSRPPDRPDPDRLLAEVQADEARQRRGRLKLFFGACPGVGKTYAMLQALHERQREGVAVCVGIVETHGRKETQALLEGLPVLPRKRLEYRGRELTEFDLDAALASSAALIAVDELAHTNAPGSRHAKRWQDVEELLAAGFDVYTTVNVQHLESLHDVVAAITGVRVRETVPDRVFDAADDVTLIDLPAADLIQRLRNGKVYLPDVAQSAVERFFRPGNLIALRELALRRVADRVDAQMRAQRTREDPGRVWPARERLLVGLGGARDAPVVRAAARLASRLEAEWIAVYVDRLDDRASRQEREAVLELLGEARRLGADVLTLAGDDVPASLVRCARERNANRIVLGAAAEASGWRRLWTALRGDLASAVQRRAPEVDVVRIGVAAGRPGAAVQARPALGAPDREPRTRHPLAWAAAACALATVVAWPLARVFDLANIVMVYLLAVVLVALRAGRTAGALAALLAVLCFDFFFVQPQLSFAVSDTQYLLTFALMLAVALIIGQLTARLRFAVLAMRERERRSALLTRLANALSGALESERIVEIAEETVGAHFQAAITVVLPDAGHRVRPARPERSVDVSIAQWVLDHGESAGAGTGTLAAAPARYLPLKAPMRVRGVLVVAPRAEPPWRRPEDLETLEACAGQIAVALERVHFVEVARDTLVQMEGERLRNTLLLSLSHDLRTPVAGMLGTAELALQRGAEGPARPLLQALVEQARAMQSLLDNLLQLARLQSGQARLDRQWHALEEIVASALGHVRSACAGHGLEVRLAAGLPLVEVDALLLERALVNLLDNACKHTPAGCRIAVDARLDPGGTLVIEVADDGPGWPGDDPSRLFAPFQRGAAESPMTGMGLGLALVERIAALHGGRVEARKREPQGSVFALHLPQRPAPQEGVET